MVTPTVGTVFQFSQQAINEFNSFNIHDSLGRLIETFNTQDGNLWNASHMAEGIYFISASKNGQRITQKIVVKAK
jgi:hypothetical protein